VLPDLDNPLLNTLPHHIGLYADTPSAIDSRRESQISDSHVTSMISESISQNEIDF
jgi:hypothetical protein